MGPDAERSTEQLTPDHLHRLAEISLRELSSLFDRRPEHSGAFRNGLMILTLCQGGAKAFFDRDHGVKDLDVWAFFRPIPGKKFPPRAQLRADFGPSKLGRNPKDDPRFRGRRIDIFGRDIDARRDEGVVTPIRRYLANRRSRSAYCLAKKPVIGIWPESCFGRTIWSLEDAARQEPAA